MAASSVTLQLPSWAAETLAGVGPLTSPEDKMTFVIGLARSNVRHRTGGPFGAAVFNMDTHELLAVGVNLVVPQSCSAAHAEMVALMLAQQTVQTFDLAAYGLPPYELVTSTEPCAMCFGAIPWSGVRRVVCGARDEDARAIGFDEGPKLSGWVSALETRHINVIQDVCRDAAADVLRWYAQQSGIIYNGGAARA